MRKLSTKPDRANPAWNSDDFKAAKPAFEALPSELAVLLPRKVGQRGPQREPVKQLVSLRIDRDVVALFRATGEGWQTRVNDVLKLAARRLG